MQKMNAGRKALLRRGLFNFILGFTDFEYACLEAGIIFRFTDLVSPAEKGMFLWTRDGKEKAILLSPSLEDLRGARTWERDIVAFHELAHAISPYPVPELRIETSNGKVEYRYSDDYETAARMERRANALAAQCLIPRQLLTMSNGQIRQIFGYPDALINFRRRIAGHRC